MFYRSFLVATLSVSLLAPIAAQRHQTAPRQRPNVLVIVLDDLGTDKLEFYGETPPTCPSYSCQDAPNCVTPPSGCVREYPATPSLDALRREGIWFTRAYATPVCSSSRANMMTGRYGLRTGVGRALSTIDIPGDYALPNGEVCLPELLREGLRDVRGVGLPYRSGAFGKWHLATTQAQDYGHAVANGFQRFYGTPGNLGNFFRYDKVEHDKGSALRVVPIDGRDTYSPDTFHASVTRRDAVEWINGQTGSFLAWVAFAPPHTPMQVPPYELLPDQTRCELECAGLAPGDFLSITGDPPDLLKLVYRALVEAVDLEIGNLIAGISPQKLRDTMIFVLGDNGTSQHAVDEPPHEQDHGKGTIYELAVRVPLIVAGPLVPEPPTNEGWQSDALVAAVDLWLTVAEVTGADPGKIVPPPQLDSMSFLPVLLDPQYPGDRTRVYSQTFSPNGVLPLPPPSCYTLNRRSLGDGEYKYIRVQQTVNGSPCGTPTYSEELYHLVVDPEETVELITAGLTPEANTRLQILRAEMDALSGF